MWEISLELGFAVIFFMVGIAVKEMSSLVEGIFLAIGGMLVLLGLVGAARKRPIFGTIGQSEFERLSKDNERLKKDLSF